MARARCRAPARSSSPTPEPAATATSSKSAPGHPGLLALALPWEGTTAHAEVDGAASITWRRSSRSRATAARDASADEERRRPARLRARCDRGRDDAPRARVDGAAHPRRRARPRSSRSGRRRPGIAPDAAGRADAAPPRSRRSRPRSPAFDFAPNRGGVFSAHQMGSVRMGADPRTHPCDPAGRVRARDRDDRRGPGLYVGDGSLFPTGIGVNPMITVMALARRVAGASSPRPDGGGRSGGRGGCRDACAPSSGSAASARRALALGAAIRPRAVTIRATATTMTVPATTVRGVDGLAQDDRAQDDRDDRVDVGVGRRPAAAARRAACSRRP